MRENATACAMRTLRLLSMGHAKGSIWRNTLEFGFLATEYLDVDGRS